MARPPQMSPTKHLRSQGGISPGSVGVMQTNPNVPSSMGAGICPCATCTTLPVCLCLYLLLDLTYIPLSPLRIRESPELEGSHQDQVQPMSLHRHPQIPPWAALEQCLNAPGALWGRARSLGSLATLWGQNLSLMSIPTLLTQLEPFPQLGGIHSWPSSAGILCSRPVLPQQSPRAAQLSTDPSDRKRG